MSTLKVNNLQVGQDATASNNFTLYQPAVPDGTVRLGVGNSGSVTDALILRNSSELILGTTTTGGALRVYGSSGRLIVGDTGVNYYDASSHNFRDYSSFASRLYIKSDGNVGIGITDPTEKLQVSGRITATSAIRAGTTSAIASSGEFLSVLGQASIRLDSTSAATTYLINADTTANTIQPYIFLSDTSGNRGGWGSEYSTAKSSIYGQGGISFQTGTSGFSYANERLLITSTGNVLIGNSATGSLGGIQSALQVDRPSSSTLNASILIRENEANTSWPKLYLSKNRSDNPMGPDNKLGSIEFYGDNGSNDELGARIEATADGTGFWSTTSRPTRLVFSVTPDGSTTLTEALRIDPTGNVGIGTDNPLTKFFVKQGSSSMGFAEYNNGATIWLDGADGDVSGGDYFNISANNSQQLTFGYAGGTNITMDSSGKLGLATTPSFHLDILTSGATSVDTIRSSASTSGSNNRVLFTSYANGGGSPYIKFDAGGTDMVVGNKWAGTTNNTLYMGPGTDIDNGYTSSGGLYVKGFGFTGVNYNQDVARQQLTVNGQYGIYRGNGNGSVWTIEGQAGTFTTLTIEVYQRDYGGFTFDLKVAAYNNVHGYYVGGGYMNGSSPIGGVINSIYSNNITSSALSGGSQASQSWKIVLTGSFVHPACEFHVSVGGQAEIRNSDISITWS